MKRLKPLRESFNDSSDADLVRYDFETFIFSKEHCCPVIMHIASPVEPRPERALRVHLVEAGSGTPLPGALIWTDWGTVGQYEEQVADHEGNAQLHMSQFYGPCRDLTTASFDLWIEGFRVGEYEVNIGDDVEIEVPQSIVGAASKVPRILPRSGSI